MKIELLGMLALGVLGGVVSWRAQRRRRRWRSLYDDTPPGMTPEQYQRRRDIRFLVRRIAVSVLCAGCAGAAGFALLAWLHV